MNDNLEELWCVRVTCDDQTGVVAEFTSALARGVKLHLEGRVFVHGQKTVVFP